MLPLLWISGPRLRTQLTPMANRYTFTTKLEGFIKLDEDGGKFNNRSFSFTIPAKDLEKINADRDELIEWIQSKDNKRLPVGLPRWDDAGLIKYSFGAGDGSRKPVPEVVFVDCDGVPLTKQVLATIRKGTKVNLILQQKPYAMGSFNTSVRVLGAQVIELVTAEGASDSGSLEPDEIAAMFSKVDGFKQGDPQVRDEREPVAAAEGGYDF